jgi:rod shape-determining protein MreC
MVETRSGRRFAILFFVGAFLVLFLGRWLTPVNHFALSVAAPFESLVSSAANGTGDTLSGIFDGNKLRSELDQIRRENARLIQANIGYQTAVHENALLKRMLGFEGKNTSLSLFGARVISTPTILDETVLIDKGTRDGLRDGMTVLDPYGFFAGHIADAGPNFSRVLLMSSPSSSIAAIDLTTRAEGLVEGQYGSNPQFNFVPIRDLVHRGDLVVTSGLYNLYPRNLLLGQIATVHHSNVEPFQNNDIRPAADLNHLEMVMVVRNFNPGFKATLP